MSDEMVHIAFIDDHRLFRQGLTSMLENESIVGALKDYPNPLDFLNDPWSRKAQILFLDINMPEMDGLKALIQIREKFPELKVIMLSMSVNYSNIQEAVSRGVVGYLNKTSEKEEVLTAIKSVLSGKPYFAQEVREILGSDFESDDAVGVIKLTPREKEILSLICREYSTQEIANQLFISANTVETHRRNLLSKTLSKNVAGLVKFAVTNGLE
ncbi:response regulator transcription factor [bacterium SCSIO 12741]|nr:response regulator transcription factor [bacterium SCSIO 12741]